MQACHACMPHTRMCSYVSHLETRACLAHTFVCSIFDYRLSGRLQWSTIMVMPLLHRCTRCANGMRAPPACSKLPLHAYACTTGWKLTLAFGQWLELRSAIPGVTSEEYSIFTICRPLVACILYVHHDLVVRLTPAAHSLEPQSQDTKDDSECDSYNQTAVFSTRASGWIT